MAFNVTPSLGADFTFVGDKHYHHLDPEAVSPKVGTVMRGDDGHEYVFVRASALIAAAAAPGTEIAVDEPAFTAATAVGGAFNAPADVAIPAQSYFWARREDAGFI